MISGFAFPFRFFTNTNFGYIIKIETSYIEMNLKIFEEIANTNLRVRLNIFQNPLHEWEKRAL